MSRSTQNCHYIETEISTEMTTTALRVRPNRLAPYLVLNAGFALLAIALTAINGGGNTIYIILLVALCSHVLIDLDALNGRYALLAFFMLIYFVSFGVGDLSNLLLRSEFLDGSFHSSDSPWPDNAERVILVGGIMLTLGYRLAIHYLSDRSIGSKDWPGASTLLLGLGLWAVGTVTTYRWYVYIIPDTTDEAFRRGLSSLSAVAVTLYLLGNMCQPLGFLLLVYRWRVSPSIPRLLVVVALVVLQMFIGFVIDSRGTAMFGVIAVIVTSVLVAGRLPKIWLVLGLIFVSLLFPYFTAYRRAVHGAGVARTSVVENFQEALKKTIAAKDEVTTGRWRAANFLERSSVKGSVEAAVAKAGSVVPYANGYTLAPILETFLPKILIADKEHIPTGQLFNKRFHLVEGDEVYISPSHLGELYWNFGWIGIVLGMTIIGILCGAVGALFNLGDAVTVTRLLITAITIRQLIISFESTISDCYVIWLRSIAAIALLHLIFARARPVPGPLSLRLDSKAALSESSSVKHPFPNLMT